MAQSYAHTWGQIVGNTVETAIYKHLKTVADKHSLYLDQQGPRAARRGKTVKWLDGYKNAHDLDYVFEREGADDKIGHPMAFVEVAWRRYTKHSKNKAQEIQGAVLPIAEKYYSHAPFLGAVVAGVFTDSALNQLRSHGFHVLYLPYESVLKAFATVEIDASSDEGMSEKEFEKKVTRWNGLSEDERDSVAEALLSINGDEVTTFVNALDASFSREVSRVYVTLLHGKEQRFTDPESAVEFVASYPKDSPMEHPIARIEVRVEYDNEDEIKGAFGSPASAVEFLQLIT